MKHSKFKTKRHKEDSIDVSTANAENRFKEEDVIKGVTKDGGNASADVHVRGGKPDTTAEGSKQQGRKK